LSILDGDTGAGVESARTPQIFCGTSILRSRRDAPKAGIHTRTPVAQKTNDQGEESLMQRGTCKLAVFTLSTTMLFGAEAMAAQGSGSATLDAVKARGQMLCGVHGQVPGFSLPDSQGVMRGLDADTCRAITAAVLGDVSKVKLVATSTQSRFTARPGRLCVKQIWDWNSLG
jgi:hypothetical protein